MDNKLVKIIGIAASTVGVVANIAANWANEKKLDDKISEKVEKAISNLSKEDWAIIGSFFFSLYKNKKGD